LIGNVVEKYEVIQKIGEGGMATVYRGRHLTLGRDVAIKVLHPHLSASERNRQRFAREARAIEHLEHDNILRIFDYSGVDADKCYIVTEFIEGLTLQALLDERRRIPGEVAAQIGLKLAGALAYAHNLGIIHRDLKLENVMIRRDGALKLMDFGIARFLDEVNLTITGALVGSPAYMSPEQAMERVLDRRSDLFSLGTLLFHLVTGQLPFTGGNPSIVLRNVIESNRPNVSDLAPDISASLADLIEQLMATDPEDRPQSAETVANRLAEGMSEVGIVPADPKWSIASWLQSPTDFGERLQQTLGSALLEGGKSRLVSKDHLGALRMFNRLLSMDENNKEVLDLIRGMHTDKPASHATRANRSIIVVGALLLSLLAAVTLWQHANQGPTVPSSQKPPAPTDVDIEAADTPEADTPPSVVATAEDPTPPNARRPPPPPPPPPRAAVPPAIEAGHITITVPGSWGDIYIDGSLIGRTGSVGAIPVTAGSHTLGIRNDHALPYRQTFTVEPGERKAISVTNLQRKPVRFKMVNAPDPGCTIKVDGIERGTVASLQATLRVRSPEKPHLLTVLCPDGTTLNRKLGPTTPGSLVTVNLGSP
jgi:serine/threonine protein kinase